MSNNQISLMRKSRSILDITSKPLAADGLLSYRCKGTFGWIMIGAKDDDDAMVQAKRSSANAQREDLQKWDGGAYVPCPMPVAQKVTNSQIKVTTLPDGAQVQYIKVANALPVSKSEMDSTPNLPNPIKARCGPRRM